MPRIRTTMRPDLEIEVTEAEAFDLANRGLIAPEKGDVPAAPAFEKEAAERDKEEEQKADTDRAADRDEGSSKSPRKGGSK